MTRAAAVAVAATTVVVGAVSMQLAGANTNMTVLVQTAGSSFEVGEPIAVNLAVGCTGNEPCTNVSITVTTAGALTGASSCNLGTLASGSTDSCAATVLFPANTPHGAAGTITATVTYDGGSASDTHTVTAINPNPPTTTTTPPVTTTTVGPTTTTGPPATTTTTTPAPPAPRARIDVSKSATRGSVYAGQSFTYRLTVRNTGDFVIDDTELSDVLPAHFTYGTPSFGAVAGGQWTADLGSLAPGESAVLSIVATADYPGPNGAYGLPSNVRNCARVTGDTERGSVTDRSCRTVRVKSPLDGVKGRSSSSVAIGDEVEFNLTTRNRGAQAISGVVLVDELPAELEPVSVRVGRWPSFTVSATVAYRSGGVWTDLGTFDGARNATYALPAGADAVRWTYSDLPGGFRSRGQRITTEVIHPDRNGLAYATPARPNNCAVWTSLTFGSDTSCKSVTVYPPAARPYVDKWNEQNNLDPLDEVSFVLRVGNSGGAELPFIDPYLADLLGNELEYVSWEPISGGPAPTFTRVDDHNGTGRTLLHWQFDRTLVPGEQYRLRVTARVAAGTPAAGYTNTGYTHTADTTHLVECHRGAVTDVFDVDLDGSTVDGTCAGSTGYSVVAKATTEAAMWVDGEVDLEDLDFQTLVPPLGSACPDNFSGFTRHPCVAQTRSLANADYRLHLRNTGNVELHNLVLYNTLPHVGDGYVSDPATQRESEWRPKLAAPVSIIYAPAGANITIEYSYSDVPCRPELVYQAPGSEWPATCDDDWGPAPVDPDDLQDVRAIRVVGEFPAGARWSGGDELLLGYDMDAEHGSPFGGEVAWTSFAYNAHRVDNGFVLPTTEPRRTGIMLKKPDNGVGDFVWLDLDRNGVQDAGEPGLNHIQVSLRRETGELVAQTRTTYLGADTSKPGYYFFGDQEPGRYYVEFEAPRVGWQSALPDLGADDVDSDGALPGMITDVFDLGFEELLLDWDQAYFLPGGPYNCDNVGPSNAGNHTRRHENDPRPCPT